MENTRSRIKTVIAAEQTTLKDVVTIMNERHPDDTTTPQNITNKLARKTIRFDEVSFLREGLFSGIGQQEKSYKKIEPNPKTGTAFLFVVLVYYWTP